MMLLTVERLREVLHYDPETGTVTVLIPRGSRARAGAVAGYHHNRGYRRLMIDRQTYLEHDLVWLYMTGEWPNDGVDHANRNKTDNRWANLRPATQAQNNANASRRSDNTSGFRGVSRYRAYSKWQSRIGVNGKRINLGYFDTPHQAYANYCLAARRHFGEYARLYDWETMIEPGPQSLGNDWLGI